MRARFVLTDRHGVRSDPAKPAVEDPRAVRAGVSAEPFDDLDLALHVGDDAEQVRANRAALAAAIGAPAPELRTMEQVHGADVAVVGPGERRTPVADALLTTAIGPRLVVQVADCVPVVLADPDAGVVAVVHAGRRGVAADVVGATVAAMRAEGSTDPSNRHAVIGPAICAACYEVPADLHDEVVALVPAAAGRSRTGTPALDLRAAVRAQLAAAGVDHVTFLGGCTAEDPNLYSYRRDGTTGRFGLVAWLAEK